MRSVALIAFVGATCLGCRSNFDGVEPGSDAAVDAAADIDAAPDPKMAVTENVTETNINVPGRFALRFEESRNWQPQRWTDESRGDIDLSGTGTGAESGSLVTPMLLCSTGGCVGADNMLEPALMIMAQDERSVTLRMSWGWTLNAIPLTGEATYTIDVDGNWMAEMSVTSGGAEIAGTMEIADTHVNVSLPWQVTADLAGTTFGFELPAEGTFDAAAFDVALVSPPSATVASDSLENRYFVTPLTLESNGTQAASWTARIWREP